MRLFGITRFVLVVVGIFALVSSAHAGIEDTLFITRGLKTAAHPHYGKGSPFSYFVNGVEAATIMLVRDSTYIIHWGAVEQDEWIFRFYDATRPQGGGKGIYDDFIILRPWPLYHVKPDDETPDTLYYGSAENFWMGGLALVVDSLPTSAVDADRGSVATNISATTHPNPVEDLARIDFVLDYASHVRLDVIDPLGHLVLSAEEMMERGDQSLVFNAEPLADGIYFFRIVALAGDRRSVLRGSFNVIR